MGVVAVRKLPGGAWEPATGDRSITIGLSGVPRLTSGRAPASQILRPTIFSLPLLLLVCAVMIMLWSTAVRALTPTTIMLTQCVFSDGQLEPWAFEASDSGRWVRKLINRRFDGFADEMAILPEPVLPVGKPGTKIPCAAWQKVFDKCVKRHENAVAGKCEYLRCKLYECRATQN
ncbi:unnamed protein product [Linum tenue]|uniref:Uncharacterized protein n=1 Tax=Linum tenue TaxID=586396 RepID=A0AAV0I390_9ROSI|nr:unnamed protein product [Linum tenue]